MGACGWGCTGGTCAGAWVRGGTGVCIGACVRGTVGATVVVEGDAKDCAESSGAGNMAAAAATAPIFLTPQTAGLLVISISLHRIRQRTATRVDAPQRASGSGKDGDFASRDCNCVGRERVGGSLNLQSPTLMKGD